MKKAKEILRLKFEAGLSNHKIARAAGVSASTVWDTVTRFKMTEIGWPLPAGMGEGELERRLYRKRGSLEANPERGPDWAEVQLATGATAAPGSDWSSTVVYKPKT